MLIFFIIGFIAGGVFISKAMREDIAKGRSIYINDEEYKCTIQEKK